MSTHEINRQTPQDPAGCSRRKFVTGALGLTGAVAVGGPILGGLGARRASAMSYTGIPLQVKSTFTPPGGAVGQSLRVTSGSGGTCYMVGRESGKVHIIDVSNPASPSLLSSISVASPSSVDALNQRLYVTDSTGHRLRIIDVSNPSSPQILGTVTSANSLTGAWDVKVAGSYAYVACRGSDSNGASEDGKLTVVNVSNPASPQIVAVVDDQYTPEPRHIRLSGNYLYLCDEHRGGLESGLGGQGSFQIFNISTPTNPVRLSRLATPELKDARKSDFTGNTVIVNGRSLNEIVAIDVSNKSNPVQLDSAGTTLTNKNHSVAISGSYAYVASVTSDAVTAWNITSPSTLVQEASISTATHLDEASEVAVFNGHLYVYARGNQKLTILG